MSAEAVKAGAHRCVGSKKIARARHSQCHFEGMSRIFHEALGALQDGEGCMPFIQMTDFWLDPESAEQPPSANPEDQFLLEAQFRATPIELVCNPSMSRKVRRVIAIQQVELHSADLGLPGA